MRILDPARLRWSLTSPHERSAIFVVCNVVIASVAVWNYSLLQNPDAIGVTGRDSEYIGFIQVCRKLTVGIGQIDAYLIILGIFGVVFIIPMCVRDLCFHFTGR